MSQAVIYDRHFTARVHQTYRLDIPDEIRNSPDYFDEDGQPTPDFDVWACDSGRLRAEEIEPLDEWDLETEVDFL